MNIFEYDYEFNIALLGKIGSGKASLIYRFIENTFEAFRLSYSLGVLCKRKKLIIENNIIKCQFFVTAASQHFKFIPKGQYAKYDGLIIVYDISDRNSFDEALHWIKEIELNAQNDIIKIIVGNKNDVNERVVSEEEGKILGDKFNIYFFETSAKTGYNVNEAFEFLIQEIFEKCKKYERAEYKLVNKKDKSNKCIK